jgi:hypothetical protein
MTKSIPPDTNLVGPRRDGETLEGFATRYHKWNNQLATKFPSSGRTQRAEPSAPLEEPENHQVRCTLCGTSSDPAPRKSEAYRNAQRAGFTQLRDKEGRPVRDERKSPQWLCPHHTAQLKARDSSPDLDKP